MKALIVSEGKHEQSGALETLVRRLGGGEATYEQDKVSNPKVHAFHGRGDGYYKRAVRWLLEAQKRDFDVLIVVIDEDGRRERATQMTEAQNSTLSHLRRALGVAIRTFDAWMLADEAALTQVLGYVVNQQPAPEGIRDPKQTCADLLRDSAEAMSHSEMYSRIARRIDINILSQRCPAGFGPFSSRVRAVFA
jgi:hypothetical protein